MSSQSANQFLQKVGEDAQLQEEIAKLMSSSSDAQPVVEIGARYSYEFTAEEIKNEVKNVQLQQAAIQSGELTENELEAVAGGGNSQKGNKAFNIVMDILSLGIGVGEK